MRFFCLTGKIYKKLLRIYQFWSSNCYKRAKQMSYSESAQKTTSTNIYFTKIIFHEKSPVLPLRPLFWKNPCGPPQVCFSGEIIFGETYVSWRSFLCWFGIGHFFCSFVTVWWSKLINTEQIFVDFARKTEKFHFLKNNTKLVNLCVGRIRRNSWDNHSSTIR